MSSPNSAALEAYLDVEEYEQRKVQSSSLVRLIQTVIQHPRLLLSGLAMVFVGTFSVLLEPRIFGYAIDEAIVPKRLNQLYQYGGLFCLVTCIRVLTAVQQGYFFELLGQRVTQDLRVKLFSHLQKLPISVFDRNPTGRLLTRVTNDISALNEMFSAGFVAMFSNVLQVVGILVWLLLLDLHLGLVSLSILPFLLLVTTIFSNRLKVAYRNARSRLSALNAFLAENLSGMKIVQLFNRQQLHMERFDRFNHWYADAQTATVRVFAFFQPTITISAGISIALMMWFGGKEAYQGNLKLGVLVAYFSYVLSLFQPIREIADKWNTFLSGMTSAERVFSILDWPVEDKEINIHLPAVPIVDLTGHIVFENVWFAYVAEDWVLRDFSLEIKPGENIGIVGHTGAGKSTLIGLLMRFYEPQKGRILLDGKDIRELDRRSLRSSVGLVQQDVFLFSGTFRENITFWKETDSAKLQSVLSELGFKRDWDSVLQERGSNLSMGERQVIAFARAMLTQPKIWILDEATAHMDSQTEERLQQALSRASARQTRILIAHRLATVKSADRIVVLSKGSLAECGHHQALVEQNGLYARLFRYQQIQETAAPVS
jgi:ATP-binding cassette subfamily B protein